MQGKIIENISNLYKVRAEDTIYEATARGKFKKDEITPVVGDNVEIEIIDMKSKKAVIEKIENRKIYVKRPKLANISQIIFYIARIVLHHRMISLFCLFPSRTSCTDATT